MIRAHPKVSIPTLKPSSTQEPTSSRATHTMLILQQPRNTVMSIKIQATQSHAKLIDTQNSLLDTSLHSREKRSSSTQQNTDTSSPNQETLTSHYSNPTHREQSPQYKEEPRNSSLQKGHPKHSNLNKMKRQRNSQEVKKHDKCPPNQTKEEDIGSLPEKEFRIMIVKMIQNLEKKKWSCR